MKNLLARGPSRLLSSLAFIALLTTLVACEYTQDLTFYISSDFKDIDLPPSQVDIYGADALFVAGSTSGRICFFHEDSTSSCSTVESSPINKVIWLSKYTVLSITSNSATLFRTDTWAVSKVFDFTGREIFNAVAQYTSTNFRVAFDFGDQIQIYEENTLLFNVTLTSGPTNSMAFDSTGNYIYLFDGTTRKVVSVNTRSIFNSQETGLVTQKLAASTSSYYQDITVGLTSTNLVVYDDYRKLSTYYQVYGKDVTFCDGYQNVVAVADQYNIINLWSLSYYYFDEWFVRTELFASSVLNKVSCKNGMLAGFSTSTNTVFLFEDAYPSGGLLAIVIVLSTLVLIGIIVGVVCCIFKKRRQQLNMNTFDGYYEENGNKGFNRNGKGPNKPKGSDGQYNNNPYNNNGYNPNANVPYGGNNGNKNPYGNPYQGDSNPYQANTNPYGPHPYVNNQPKPGNLGPSQW